MTENIKSMDRAKEAAEESIEHARTAVSETVGAAKERLQGVTEGVGTKIKDVSDDLSKQATRASEFARDRYGVAVDNLRQGYATARKDLDRLSQDVTAYVRDNPGRSVLVAAAAGFLIGFLVRTRR